MTDQQKRQEYCELIGLLLTHREAIVLASDGGDAHAFTEILDTVRYLRDAIPLDDDVMGGFKR